MNLSGGEAIAGMVGAIVLTATAGDVLLASAMRAVGDLDEIKAEHGLRRSDMGSCQREPLPGRRCLHGA